MTKFELYGSQLAGRIDLQGSKNATVPILPSAILSSEPVTISNIPLTQDVSDILNAMSHMNIQPCLSFEKGYYKVRLEMGNGIKPDITNSKAHNTRASILFLGSMLGRFKKALIPLPGGCKLGSRSIDLHVKGIEKMGAKITIHDNYLEAECDRLQGCDIHLTTISVGATQNIINAAVLAKGTTRILHAAIEPEIISLAEFLNQMGAKISINETERIIQIEGVDAIGIANHSYHIPYDRIQFFTYATLSALYGGSIEVGNVDSTGHFHYLADFFKTVGINIFHDKSSQRVSVSVPNGIKPFNIETNPYPKFSTDLQPFATLLALKADGESVITENIFEKRMLHVQELQKMGANIKIDGNKAIINYTPKLKGAEVTGTDLRAGAALTIAGLIAGEDEKTTVSNVGYIDRGYWMFENFLAKCGAKITRIIDKT